MSADGTSDNRLPRAEASFEPSHRFILGSKDYTQQYSHLYSVRLKQVTNRIRGLAVQKFGNDVPILSRIIDSETKDQTRNECIVIGTLFKEMDLRGSVLDEFKDHNGISGGVQTLHNFASKHDFLVLEDDSGRLGLGGDMIQALAPTTVTGVVVAVKGYVNEGGVFEVNGVVFPGQETTPIPSSSASSSASSSTSSSASGMVPDKDQDTDKYLLLMSGLEMGATKRADPSSDLAAQLLMDFVAGRLGGTEDVRLASRVVRVIVAGNSVTEATVQVGKERFTGSKQQSEATLPMKQVDTLFASALGCCPIELMPGAFDPTNLVLPQQPLHPCLLPHSARFTSFTLATNPYEAKVDGVHVMGHAGQPVDDIARQTIRVDGVPESVTAEQRAEVETAGGVQGDEPLNILRNTLRWGHLCPTAPDTLPCYPFTDHDPFVIGHDTATPLTVLFAGNQPTFASSLETSEDGRRTLFVCVPSFRTTRQVVLVNLRTLVAREMSFQVGLGGMDTDEGGDEEKAGAVPMAVE